MTPHSSWSLTGGSTGSHSCPACLWCLTNASGGTNIKKPELQRSTLTDSRGKQRLALHYTLGGNKQTAIYKLEVSIYDSPKNIKI